jgi:hypothetical protein
VHGCGLYLTDDRTEAEKYAKGGGKVLRFEVDNDLGWIEKEQAGLEAMVKFALTLRGKNKRAIADDLLLAAERRGSVSLPLSYLNNLAVNYDMVGGANGPKIAEFFVKYGGDASRVDRSFGGYWVVLFNMDAILDIRSPHPVYGD